MAEGIIREREESEKRIKEGGFYDIRNWQKTDVKQLAMKTITNIETNHLYKLRKPYCRKCAINAVDKRIEEVNILIQKAKNRGKSDIKIDFKIDFEKFGEKGMFEYLDNDQPINMPESKGSHKIIQTGVYKEFKCKECGSNIAMQFENEELEKPKTPAQTGTPSTQ